MIKYVVKYVFFERARVWMYLLCDEVALLFFFGYHNAVNPNFKKMEREGHALPLCDKSDVNGCVA